MGNWMAIDALKKKYNVGGTTRVTTPIASNAPTRNRTTNKDSAYSNAVQTLKSSGVSDAAASGIMTRNEWLRRKKSSGYNTYEEYLDSLVGTAKGDNRPMRVEHNDDYWQNRFETLTAKLAEDHKGEATYRPAAEALAIVQKEKESAEAAERERERLKRKQERQNQIQDYMELQANPDFWEYAEKGAAIENPDSLTDARGWLTSDLFGWYPFGEEVGNPVTFTREQIKSTPIPYSKGSQYAQGVDRRAQYMTDEEVNIYNYLLAKEGIDKAGEYFDVLAETLNQREGYGFVESIENGESAIGRHIGGVFLNGFVPMANYVEDVKQNFFNEPFDKSSVRYAQEEYDKYLGEFDTPKVLGRTLPQLQGDITKQISYQVPAWTAAAITGSPNVASIMVGLGASGSDYADKKREGYSTKEARIHSALVGGSEALLSKALSSFGNTVTKGGLDAKLTEAIGAIDNALWRFSAFLGKSVTEEEIEENAQLWIEKALDTLVLNKEFTAPTLEEHLYTSLLTALSTGPMAVRGSFNSAKADTLEQENKVNEMKYLTEKDYEQYMKSGNQHSRNKKSELAKEGISPIMVSRKDTDTFIEAALEGKLKSQIRAFSKATERMVNDVKGETDGNIDIEGYYLELNSDDIHHLTTHTNENTHGQIRLTTDEIKNIPLYMTNYDDLIDVHRQRDGRLMMTVGKKINGHSVLVSILSSGRKALALKTAYVLDTDKYNEVVNNKKSAKSQEATESQSETMPTTSKNVPTIALYDNTIPQSGNVVKEGDVALAERLEAQSQNNEPIAAEDIKKATVFGDEGSKLVAEIANKDGVTFSQAERAVKTAYMAGFANVESSKVSFETDTQIDAFTAGKKDRVMQDLAAKENANQKRVKSGMSAEEGYNYFTSLTEDDNRIRTAIVNGITIKIERRFGGGYFVTTEFNNGEKLTPWTASEEFDTFEEAKNHAAMLSYDAAEYDGGLAPIDKFYGRNVSGVRLDDSGVDTQSTTENEKNTTDKAENVTGEDGKSYDEGKDDSTDSEDPVESMYDIPEGSEIVNNIVVDEHSKRLKRENPRAYSNIIRMARRLGMNVRFVENLTDENGKMLEGLITSKGIFINADAKNPSRFVATHEFGHRMKQAAPKVWAKYQEYVINKLKRESFDSGRVVYDVLYEETKKAYGKDDADYINEEIAVNYAGELFDSEEMLESFIREDKGLALRVRDWWYNVLESMGLLSEKKKAQQLWLKAYSAAEKNVKDGKVGAYRDVKKSYAGVNAKLADINILSSAQKMESEGKSAEEIWEKTGWGRGLDGKWRFEISDFESYLVENPELETRHSDDGDYYVGRLGDVFKHDKLFKAYPHLKESRIIIQEMKPGTQGSAFGKRNEIVLSKTLFEKKTKEYRDLLTNRQRYISEIEQTQEYKRYNAVYEMSDNDIEPVEWLKLEEKARNEFFSSDIGKRYYELKWGKDNVQKYELGWSDKAKEVLLHEVQHLIQHKEGFAKGSNPRYWEGKKDTSRNASDLYENTAGEIEARNVQMRRDMTEEERRNTYPESFKMNDNVVFADTEVNYDIVTLDNGKTYIEATRQVLTGSNISEWRKSITKFFNKALKNGDIKITATDGSTLTITKDTAKKARDNYKRENGQIVKMSDDEFLVKLHAESHIDEIAEISKKVSHSSDGKSHPFATDGFDYKVVYFKDFDNSYYKITLSVGLSNGVSTVYNVGKIKTDNLPTGKIISRKVGQSPMANLSVDTTISQDNTGVNTNSMQNTAENAQEGKKSIAGTRISELVEKYGAIPKGENPVRDIDVPKKTADGRKVSQTVRTILEAKATPDEVIPSIEKMVTDGDFSYDTYTDKKAIENGEDYIKEHGWEESLIDWFEAVNSGEVSKDITTTGWILYNHAANSSDTKNAIMILDAMVRHQRNAAQALQATRILKKLSPETQLYGVQKSVQAFQKELAQKYGDKAPNLKINKELAEQFLNAETEEERLDAEIEIYKDIGRQMPSDWIDMWNAWRYVAMLTNLRTHGRNILGNAGFAPVVIAKDLTATAIESAVASVARWSGREMIRGKALVWGSKGDKALLKAAWNDYPNVADIISNGGKYNDSAIGNKYIQEGRRIFKGVLTPIEWVRRVNGKLLELEDMWFSKPHYAYALAQYCKANNITAEQISRGKAIAPAREYAIKEAQKATYKDTNAFSQMVSEVGRHGKRNWATNAKRTIVEGALPFRKTPANILVRGVEYSPLGLLKGLSYDLVQVSKGKMWATEAIDNISAGLTGTGLLALGIYLAAQGLIRGHGEEDKDEKEFKELTGHQSYALELPSGQSITLDWLAPESLPFFTGVAMWEMTTGDKKEITLADFQTAINGISDPMLEMSFLQGLNDALESIGYAKSNEMKAVPTLISTIITSYLSQGIPTLFGQIERTGEENRMTTYTGKDSSLTKDTQYALGKASAKIPFWDYNQIPYVDAWGRKEASGTALKRGLNNFLNPAYTSTVDESKMEKELLRLYEATGEGGVFPERADKYFTVDGKRKDLTGEEYVRYATLKGQKSYKLVSDLVKSNAYKKLSDEEKAKAVKEAYDYANQKAKQAISNYKPDTWVQKADEFGSNVGSYISFKTEVGSAKEDNGGKISKQEVAGIALDMAQNDSDTWKMYLSMYDSDSDLYAYNNGVDGEDYMHFLEALAEVDAPTKSGKYGTYTQAEATKAVNRLEGLTRKEKSALWQSVNTTWKKNPF